MKLDFKNVELAKHATKAGWIDVYDSDSFTQIGISDVNDLLLAKTPRMLKEYYGTHDVLFADFAYPGENVEQDSLFDLSSFRDSLIFGLRLCELAQRKKLTEKDLVDFGFSLEPVERIDRLSSLRADSSRGLSRRPRKECGFCAKLDYRIETRAAYRSFLGSGFDYRNTLGEMDDRDATERSDHFTAHLQTGLFTYEDTSEGRRKCVTRALDALNDLHMSDVHASSEGGKPVMRAWSVASSLWFCAMCAATGENGRVVICEMCGLPRISIGERGIKSAYCSPACNTMFQRVSKYVRSVDAGMDEEGAAKQAGVALATARKLAPAARKRINH